MKHAYLIIAHNEPWLLKILVEMLDDERNDIYITIDSRTDITSFNDVKAIRSKLVFTKQCNNRWGSVKQIETEYELFETASKAGPYAYYHLLSGIDLPIKSQDYIHSECDKLQGKEFVGFVTDSVEARKGIERKTGYYYVLQTHFRSSNKITSLMVKVIQTVCILMQRMLGLKRKYDVELKKGCNWVSITDDFCKYLIASKTEVLRMFNHTFCPDEIFLQTLLWNSPFRENIYDYSDEYRSCRRKIDWQRGLPYTWLVTDIDELFETGNESFFARKFTSRDETFVAEIVKRVEQTDR